MKLEDIEGHDTLATKLEYRELSLQIRELRAEVREQLIAMKDQIQRIKLIIWLPVITGVIQILITIFHK